MNQTLLSLDHLFARWVAWIAQSLHLTPRGLDIVMFLLLGLSAIIVSLSQRVGTMLALCFAIMGVLILGYVNLMSNISEETIEKVYRQHHTTWQSPWRPIVVIILPFAFYAFPTLREVTFLWSMMTLADYARSLHLAHFLHKKPPS